MVERETGFAVPGTKHRVEFTYRLAKPAEAAGSGADYARVRLSRANPNSQGRLGPEIQMPQITDTFSCSQRVPPKTKLWGFLR
jgi:hypothetical protein